MKLQLVSFETSKLLHEVGFVGYKSNRFYYKDGTVNIGNPSEDWTQWEWTQGIRFVAPYQHEVQSWLRNTHKVHVNPIPYLQIDYKVTGYYVGEIINSDGNILYEGDGNYHTYEDSLEKGIQEALKLL